MSASYLNTINYFLDKQCLVEDLAFVKDDSKQKEKYQSGGTKFHYKTDKPLFEMAYELLSDFVRANSGIKDEIDFVIFTTDDLDESGNINVVSVNTILKKVSMLNAFPIFQGFGLCANSSAAFLSACSLIESGRAKNVLVISVDKVKAEDVHYQMKPEMSVLSDAGVCLWVSSKPSHNAFSVEGIFQKNNPDQWIIDRNENFQQYSVNKLRLFAYLSKQIKNSINGVADHYVLNNYFKHVIDMFIGVLGIPSSKVNVDNIARMGHAPAGDVFINLADLIENKSIQEGSLVVLVSDSPSLCSAIILKKTAINT